MFQSTTYLLKKNTGIPSGADLTNTANYQKIFKYTSDIFGPFCRDVSSA